MSDATPLVLIAVTDRAQRQALASALEDAGFRVGTAQTEREIVDFTHATPPDAIVVDLVIAPPDFSLFRALHTYALGTPIVLVVRGDVTHALELEAIRAGAWAVFGSPLDTDTLLVRLSVFIEPKRELERVSEVALVDRVSGLYNRAGLTLRAAELAALATRHGLALACVVFRPTADLPTDATSDHLARAFKRLGRASDALGRTGPAEFAVFAPATNVSAIGLSHRMSDNVATAFVKRREPPRRIVRSAYSTALPAQHIAPMMLLARARMALDTTP